MDVEARARSEARERAEQDERRIGFLGYAQCVRELRRGGLGIVDTHDLEIRHALEPGGEHVGETRPKVLGALSTVDDHRKQRDANHFFCARGRQTPRDAKHCEREPERPTKLSDRGTRDGLQVPHRRFRLIRLVRPIRRVHGG